MRSSPPNQYQGFLQKHDFYEIYDQIIRNYSPSWEYSSTTFIIDNDVYDQACAFFREYSAVIPRGMKLQLMRLTGSDSSSVYIQGSGDFESPHLIRGFEFEYKKFTKKEKLLNASDVEEFLNCLHKLQRLCDFKETYTRGAHHFSDSSDFGVAVNSLYQAVGSKLKINDIGADYSHVSELQDPNVIAILETEQLRSIMESSQTDEAKLAAIKAYKEKCTASLPLWIARIALDVVFAAIGAVLGAFAGSLTLNPAVVVAAGVTGASAGVAIAEKVCRSTFFARSIYVDKVAAVATEAVQKTGQENLLSAVVRAIG